MFDFAGRPQELRQSAVLLTGATGFIGALIAAVLLGRETMPVVALVREGHDFEGLAARILPELEAEGRTMTLDALRQRLTLVTLPASDDLNDAAQALRRLDIADVIHCAGCLDYFNDVELEKVNINLTRRMLDLTRNIGARRFTFISTAFSSGYVDGVVAERLHGSPKGDPTSYTRTKREAEWLVAHSGIPYLIIRPSVVIGDSRSGRYSGKRYGLYQLWGGLERLLYDRYHPELHVVAPRKAFNFIHQDAFQNAFHSLFNHLTDGSIINLVSSGPDIPTVRDIWGLWLDTLGHPDRLHYYDHLGDVPLNAIHPRQRAFIMFASVNIEIAAHFWDFDTATLDQMKAAGLDFTDATLNTIARCQEEFLTSSSRLQHYLRELMPERILA